MDTEEPDDRLIQQWLDEEPSEEEFYEPPPKRPLWDPESLPPEDDEGPIKEHPATKRWRRDRQFSLDWGWIWDLKEECFYLILSWFTVDVVAGVMRGIYGVVMLILVGAIFYYSFYAADRPSRAPLPSVESLMKPDCPEDGPPDLMEEQP